MRPGSCKAEGSLSEAEQMGDQLGMSGAEQVGKSDLAGRQLMILGHRKQD